LVGGLVVDSLGGILLEMWREGIGRYDLGVSTIYEGFSHSTDLTLNRGTISGRQAAYMPTPNT
jgi:hypothetical protein